MSLLKKENWAVNLILLFISQGVYVFVLAHLMKLYEKGAWYTKWQNWLIGFLCLVFPVFIMISILQIQLLCKIAAKLEVPGSEIYNSPYFWLLAIIIPIVGWSLFLIFLIYIEVYILVHLKRGYGENINLNS